MFDGQIAVAINVTQLVTFKNDYPWTGSLDNGLASPGHELGSSSPYTGISYYSTQGGWMGAGASSNTSQHYMYAISSLRVVLPNGSSQEVAVPEPATLTSLAGGVALLALRKRRAAR